MVNHDEYEDARPVKRPRMSLSDVRKSLESQYNVAFKVDDDVHMSDDIEDFSPPPTPSSRSARKSTAADGASQIRPQATSASQHRSMRPPAHALPRSTSSISVDSTSNRAGPSNWRVLEPPSLSSLAGSSAATASTTSGSTISKNSKALAPASSWASRLDLTSISSKPKFSATGKILKPLPPPPVIAKKPAPKRRMTTISQTSVARALDPFTEEGQNELFTLWMLAHPSGYVDPETRELTRGLHQSPEKRRKDKEPKFRRGGLAERMNAFLGPKNPSFRLWRITMEKLKCRALWDVRLFILSVEAIPQPTQLGRRKEDVLTRRSVLVHGIVVKTGTCHDVRIMQPGDEIRALFMLHPKGDYKPLPGEQLSPAENLEADIMSHSGQWSYIPLPRTGTTKQERVFCFEQYRLFEVDDPETYKEELKTRFPKGPRPFPMKLTQQDPHRDQE